MNKRFGSAAMSWTALAVGLLMAGHAAAAELTVVELFTSQGCSSCPPANANFGRLAGDPRILALSFSVTYWNRLGWTDTFSNEAYTDRQVAYERPLGRSGPFTPQIVVNGRADLIGNEFGPLKALVATSGALSGPAVAIDNGRVSVGPGKPPAGGADIWLVRYDPGTVTVSVKRGENGGRMLPHTHVVHELKRLGGWSGAARSYVAPASVDGLATAVLVQAADGGPILAAAKE